MFFSSDIATRPAGRRVVLLCLLAVSLSGCFAKPRHDFREIFAMVNTADEALDAFQPPKTLRLQDDMVLYTWDGRKEIVIPAHTEWVRTRWPRRDGFFDYYEVWVPDTTHVRHCAARMVADPDGNIVYRAWRGNACESFVRYFPAWYDPTNPGTRRPVSGVSP